MTTGWVSGSQVHLQQVQHLGLSRPEETFHMRTRCFLQEPVLQTGSPLVIMTVPHQHTHTHTEGVSVMWPHRQKQSVRSVSPLKERQETEAAPPSGWRLLFLQTLLRAETRQGKGSEMRRSETVTDLLWGSGWWNKLIIRSTMFNFSFFCWKQTETFLELRPEPWGTPQIGPDITVMLLCCFICEWFSAPPSSLWLPRMPLWSCTASPDLQPVSGLWGQCLDWLYWEQLGSHWEPCSPRDNSGSGSRLIQPGPVWTDLILPDQQPQSCSFSDVH